MHPYYWKKIYKKEKIWYWTPSKIDRDAFEDVAIHYAPEAAEWIGTGIFILGYIIYGAITGK